MSAALLSELLDDINGLRNTIGYLENRILRKQIAIEEILNRSDVRNDLAPSTTATACEPVKEITVKEMVENVLPELNGSVFWYSDVKSACITKYPQHEDKIRRGIHPACHVLLVQGVIEKCPGGLRRTLA